MSDPDILPDNRPEIIGSLTTIGPISARQINKELNFTWLIRTVEWTNPENTTGNYWKITHTGTNFGGAGLMATSGYSLYFSDGSQFLCQDGWIYGAPEKLILGFTASSGWTPPSPLYAGVGTPNTTTNTISLNSATVRTLLGKPTGPISFSDARGKSKLGLSWLMTNRSGSSTPQNTAVSVDVAGNVYMTGWDNLTGLGYYSYVYKYSAAGELMWARRLSEPTAATPYNNVQSMSIDSQGSVYVTGIANVASSGLTYRGYLVKINPADGSIVWTKSWSDLVGYTFRAYIDASDNIYVTGSANADGSSQAGILKLNSSGVQQWGRWTGDGSTEQGKGSAVDSSGNVYQMMENQGTPSRPAIIKYNSSGTRQWTRTFYDSSSGYNYGVDIALDSSGSVYGLGRIRDLYAGIVKYDSAGTVQWQRELSYTGGGDNWVMPSKIFASEDKNYIYVVAYGNDSVLGRYYGAVAKYNTSGTMVWARRLDAPDGITLVSGVERGGFVYIAGWRSSSPSVGITMKVPADGTLTRKFSDFTYSSFSSLASSTVSYTLDNYDAATTTNITYTEISNLEALVTESPTISRVSI